MSASSPSPSMSWSARLLIALSLILVGAGAAIWALARYDSAARLLGVTPAVATRPAPVTLMPIAPAPAVGGSAAADARVAALEARLQRVETATQRAEGSAVRADALLVAFAARRAVERGVALGYLEPLLVDRFGSTHPRAVATIVTGARTPILLNDLIAEYENLGPQLRAAGPDEGWWRGFKRELGSLIEIHRAGQPSTKPDARYRRALARLSAGEVDSALAETMRLPGAVRAEAWSAKARRYVALRRALDEIESSALLVGNRSAFSRN